MGLGLKMQMKQLCKYFLIVTLFLLPGMIMSFNIDKQHVVSILEGNSTSVVFSSGAVVPISTIYVVMSDAFSAIRLVETLKMGEVNPYRDFFKVVHPVSGYCEAEISPQAVSSGNFMHLLSERHYQGFYIYLRKLVI